MGKPKTVQIGRVAIVNFGCDADKLAVIVDVVDQSRALVEGLNGLERQTIPIRRLSLTPVTMKIGRGARPGVVAKAASEQKVVDKFNQTSWGKKLNNSRLRANLSDFDRFKLMVLRKKKSVILDRRHLHREQGPHRRLYQVPIQSSSGNRVISSSRYLSKLLKAIQENAPGMGCGPESSKIIYFVTRTNHEQRAPAFRSILSLHPMILAACPRVVTLVGLTYPWAALRQIGI
jgi:large subunit ribosomal protein L14e